MKHGAHHLFSMAVAANIGSTFALNESQYSRESTDRWREEYR